MIIYYILAKSLTVSNNEQFMHAVKVDFTCEVKGMVEVGGVPKEVKGMISIINNDDNSQIVSAVNTNLNRQSEEEYLEPVAVSKCVKITVSYPSYFFNVDGFFVIII